MDAHTRTDGQWGRYGGERVKVNFLIFYEIDQQDVKTVLRLAEYGGDEDMSWILLDKAQAGANKWRM